MGSGVGEVGLRMAIRDTLSGVASILNDGLVMFFVWWLGDFRTTMLVIPSVGNCVTANLSSVNLPPMVD